MIDLAIERRRWLAWTMLVLALMATPVNLLAALLLHHYYSVVWYERWHTDVLFVIGTWAIGLTAVGAIMAMQRKRDRLALGLSFVQLTPVALIVSDLT